MITKEQALRLLHSKMQSVNLRKHCYAVGAVMCDLAKHFGEDEDLWEAAGLVHDVDYEEFPDTHPIEGIKLLTKENYPKEIVDAVAAHGWNYREGLPKPKNKMEWSLYSCDELTGLIVACTLVRPDKKLSSLDVASVQKKWNQKSFAAGVNRSQIENCEKELGIPLPEFIQIALTAMQGISKELGL
jgi:putative nucleotidyltransferase with HDIG domain